MVAGAGGGGHSRWFRRFLATRRRLRRPIQTDDGSDLDAEEIRQFCRGKIAHYKVPRYVHVTPTFPMTVTGKVQKYLLREQSIELLGLEGAAAIETA